MAELLQRQHSLPVVKVRLVEYDSRPAAQVELVANVAGSQAVRSSRIDPLRAYGFDEPGGPSVPPDVVSLVSRWVREEIDPDGSGQPVLWLHLVKPYGLLGTVPWERSLHGACMVPLLRLPDVLPAADRPASSYAIALCLAHADARAAPIARAVRQGCGWNAHVHVFVPPGARSAIRKDLHEKEYTVHEAAAVRRSLTTRHRNRRSAWLDSIRDGLRGITVDAVHFVAQGHFLGLEGALLLPATCEGSVEAVEPVQVGELRTFLTDVGAIVAGFSAPTPDDSPAGLLKLVDELGALRAGPVLLESGSLDALRTAYELLSSPGPGRPPSDPDLVLFAQPRQIATTLPENAPELRTDELRPSPAVQEQLERDDTPQWVAAAERFIAEQEAELVRFRQSIERERPTRAQEAHFDGVNLALRRIRAAVDQQVGTAT